MRTIDDYSLRLGRRAFLQNGTLFLTAAATVNTSSLFADEGKDRLRVGLITDLHHADKPPAGTRHYRETLGKLAEAATQFEKDKVNFVVELGDLIDAADSVETEQRYLKTINREFSAISKDRHYVLGNHCVDTLTKAEFLGGVEQESRTIPSTVANSISSFWTPASVTMVSTMAGRTRCGTTPTSRLRKWSGYKPI